MGKWFSKTHLTWREPQVLVRGRMDEALKTWSTRSRLMYVLLAPLLLLPPWFIAWELDNSKALPPQIAIPMTFALGFLLVYGAPQFQRRWPSGIHIMEHGIARSNPGISWWTYDCIDKCSFGVREVEAQQIRILTVTLKQGGEMVLGIESTVSQERVEELLREKRVRLEGDGMGEVPERGFPQRQDQVQL